MNKSNVQKIIALCLILSLVLVFGAGCGSNSNDEEDKTIKVAASSTPHAEILKECVKALSEKGYTLEITEFSDYVQPNSVVESGEFDANYFQHAPYLDNFNIEHGTNLVSAGKIHYEPLGIYPGISDSLENIKEGAVIVVPNDTTNEARALLLLEANGIITLKEGAGYAATVTDIVKNPKNLEIKELEAAQIPRMLDEVDYVVLNGNYAITAGFNVVTDALAKEEVNSEVAQTYANIIAVKEGNESNEKIKALIEVLKSDAIKAFITDNYEGAVIPLE